MRLIEAEKLKKRNDVFVNAYGGELAKVIMDGFNDVIDHTPSFDLKKHDAEIRADERRKVLHEQRALDVNLQISAEELRADAIRKFARWLRYKGVIGNKVIANGDITDYATYYVSKYEEDQQK